LPRSLPVDGGVHKVKHVGDDLRCRIVRDYVTVVITKLISRRRRRHIAVIRPWNGAETSAIVGREPIAGSYAMAPVRIPAVLREIVSVVTDEPVPVSGPETILRPGFVAVPVATAVALLIALAVVAVPAILRDCRSRYR
jgi:hypothetical protein